MSRMHAILGSANVWSDIFLFCFSITLLCSMLPTLLVDGGYCFLLAFSLLLFIISFSSFNLSIYAYLVVNPPPPLTLKIFSHIESIFLFLSAKNHHYLDCKSAQQPIQFNL